MPKYTPTLNPVEKVWWRLKDKIVANHCYTTLEDLMKAVRSFLAQLSDEEFLPLTSLLPEKNFCIATSLT